MPRYDTTWWQWLVADSAATTCANTVWSCWVGNLTTDGTTTATTSAWINWLTASSVNNTYMSSLQEPRTPAAPETPRVRRQREAAERRLARERHVAARRRVREEQVARRRADKLLRRELNWHQRRTWVKGRYVDVQGASGRWYRIHEGWAGNVHELAERGGHCTGVRHCVHPREDVPHADNVLAQLLFLRTSRECEEHLLRTANRTPGHPRCAPVDLQAWRRARAERLQPIAAAGA